MKRILLAVVIALAAAPAWAEDDGAWSLDSCGFLCVQQNINVANDAITTEEILNGTVKKEDLAPGLKTEIEGKADKTYVDSENDAQDVEIGKKANKTYVDQKNAQQNAAIAYNYAWDWAQQKQLWNHNERIGSLEQVTQQHETRLNAHDALLSQHTARLDEHEKGLAIAMAMPDAWLSDKKRFGVFGAIGGFGDETALGFAAIGRIDETFSLNAKLGSDMDFEQFGWQVGVGAQW